MARLEVPAHLPFNSLAVTAGHTLVYIIILCLVSLPQLIHADGTQTFLKNNPSDSSTVIHSPEMCEGAVYVLQIPY